jgi:DNA-binding CsgD family transcriptional regulator
MASKIQKERVGNNHRKETERFECERLITWLATNPTMSEIAHRFVTDFFSEYGLDKVRISWISDNDDMEVIGEFGYPVKGEISAESSLLGLSFPGAIWRKDPHEVVQIALNKTSSNWTKDGQIYVMHLTRSNMSIGLISFHALEWSCDSQEEVERRFDPYISILSLYLSLIRKIADLEESLVKLGVLTVSERSDLDVRINLLSDRQLRVVRLMAHNKANAQIATELGFSLSTIHSDSIDIYKILGVNSRRGAVDAIRARLDGEMDEMRDQ